VKFNEKKTETKTILLVRVYYTAYQVTTDQNMIKLDEKW